MERLFSVKMRSSKEGIHISGAERIVPEHQVEEVVGELYRRAREHSRGEADFISIKVEKLKERPVYLKAPPIYELKTELPIEEILTLLFRRAGISENLGLSIYSLILRGASPSGRVMRGAMIVEVPSGRRLEPDGERGVRASYLDISEVAARELKKLAGNRFTENLKEALTLTTKILNYPGVLGELCVSDDPDYTTGYFSIPKVGYFRIFNIKPKGLPFGGRAIFVKENINVEEFIEYLEKKPIIVSEVVGYSSISLGEEAKFPDLTLPSIDAPGSTDKL